MVNFVIKLLRADGECLGAKRRGRTQQAAISHGEPQADVDPWISEWDNPMVFIGHYHRRNA